MTTEKYFCQPTNVYGQFVFDSIGPNGKIKKMVQYEYMYQLEEGIPLFNLSFGDHNATDHTYSCTMTSNNEDKNKVLATVANTVLDFSKPYNKIAIHAEGITPSRTRLYQIGINAHKAEIEKQFQIFGAKNGYWYSFEHGINYEAFLIIKNIIKPIKQLIMDSKNNIKNYVRVSGPNGYLLPDPRYSQYFIDKFERAMEFMKNHPFPVKYLRAQ